MLLRLCRQEQDRAATDRLSDRLAQRAASKGPSIRAAWVARAAGVDGPYTCGRTARQFNHSALARSLLCCVRLEKQTEVPP